MLYFKQPSGPIWGITNVPYICWRINQRGLTDFFNFSFCWAFGQNQPGSTELSYPLKYLWLMRYDSSFVKFLVVIPRKLIWAGRIAEVLNQYDEATRNRKSLKHVSPFLCHSRQVSRFKFKVWIRDSGDRVPWINPSISLIDWSGCSF